MFYNFNVLTFYKWPKCSISITSKVFFFIQTVTFFVPETPILSGVGYGYFFLNWHILTWCWCYLINVCLWTSTESAAWTWDKGWKPITWVTNRSVAIYCDITDPVVKTPLLSFLVLGPWSLVILLLGHYWILLVQSKYIICHLYLDRVYTMLN